MHLADIDRAGRRLNHLAQTMGGFASAGPKSFSGRIDNARRVALAKSVHPAARPELILVLPVIM
jgi:hypothetical protein